VSIINRLEIDVMQKSEIYEAAELAYKHSIPSLIVHPTLASDAHIIRGSIGGRFNIITPIDWPKGENFGPDQKFRGLNIDSLEADGFEIMLSSKNGEIETRKEAQTITNFIKTHISSIVEIRFVINTQDNPDVESIVKGLTKMPLPTMLRCGINLKTQVSKANPKIHNETTKKILDIIGIPIKVCGNINDIKTIAACEDTNKFAVSLMQAKTIINEFNKQPEGIYRILNSGDNSEKDM